MHLRVQAGTRACTYSHASNQARSNTQPIAAAAAASGGAWEMAWSTRSRTSRRRTSLCWHGCWQRVQGTCYICRASLHAGATLASPHTDEAARTSPHMSRHMLHASCLTSCPHARCRHASSSRRLSACRLPSCRRSACRRSAWGAALPCRHRRMSVQTALTS